VAATAILVPVRRIGATEAVQRVLYLSQFEVVGGNLDDQDDDIDVVEEIEIEVHDVEVDRLIALLEGHAHFCHVVAAEDADRRFASVRDEAFWTTALAVQKALNIGQEGDEFAVMALVELLGVAAEFVREFAPRVVGRNLLQQLAVVLQRAIVGQGHQLQRPQQDLPEMPDSQLGRIVAISMAPPESDQPAGSGFRRNACRDCSQAPKAVQAR
jgi:hypothetical protein